ncbi:hypothetical protein EYF80_016342 [Liparis tanakae]|uniref:Secreted protein n=1 Tax=Liparis tanakae TaxID=230148 RepID=A0A4Z2I626_9TELE|nr:hypothetical protein EYF80_016342 [Liparis tanakae]
MVTFLCTAWLTGLSGQLPCCCTGSAAAADPFPLCMEMMGNTNEISSLWRFCSSIFRRYCRVSSSSLGSCGTKHKLTTCLHFLEGEA